MLALHLTPFNGIPFERGRVFDTTNLDEARERITPIFNEPTLKVLQINVETYKSVVQLSGFANSNTDISTASKVAQSVTGVKSVKNDMRLK